MFVLSKLAWVFGQPLSVAFFLVFLTLVAIILRRRALSLGCSALATAILFVAFFTSAGNFLMEGLENRFPKPSDPPDVKCMIVLGGAFENEVNTVRHGIEFNAGADRFIEALRLARKYPASKILISGGDGSLSGVYEGDAAAADRFFPMFGVPADRLISEKTSRTTFENAINTKQFLADNGLTGCLLITSGYHMPRSVGIFRKLSIDIIPWPTDYRTDGQVRFALDFTQPSLNVQNLSTTVREWFGLVGYYLAGRTSELYPR
ncbi:YdcF family protein [Oryzifoliimicrobium ureilyticus]|uniref:YdcF family protein n=1 Tax=Oryzifoliimicrobium ureilyticus TaxID=3113724 RepID=UPI0030761CF9